MEFLRLLEGLRTPALDGLMAAVTKLGDETVFMLLAITIFWCVSKRLGYYVFAVGLTGTALNQWLKLIFRIPRPWMLDPNFTIVESARAAAQGYSFPSGHTQNIVGTLGCIAVANKQRWLRVVCAVFIILVPFSRMYLGVHTPLDVGTSFALAVALVFAFRPCFRDDERFQRSAKAVLLGAILGLAVAYWVDETRLHFDVKAPLPGQICKVVLGLALLMAVRTGAKSVLNAVTGGALWANAVRYFLMVAFAGCVWPMTFPFFAKLGKK